MLQTPEHFDSAVFETRETDRIVSLYFRKGELLVNEAGDAPASLSELSGAQGIAKVVVGTARMTRANPQ
jgi:hypothetical protein